VLATNVEYWSAVVLDTADVPADMFTSMFTVRARRRLVGAHPRAEARGAADPPDRQVRRAGAARGGGGG
jgi:citrate synthase